MWAVPNTPRETFSSPSLHSKIQVKLESMRWCLTESDAFCVLLLVFVRERHSPQD